MELERLGAAATAGEIVERCRVAGAVIVEGLCPGSLVDRLNAELEPYLAQTEPGGSGSAASDAFLGHATRRLQGLLAKAPAFVEVMLEPRLLGSAEAILAPISPQILLNSGEVIEIGPGERAQPWHRDDDAWNFAHPGHPMLVNSILALVDIDADMGGTLVAPGSHLWEPGRLPEPDEVVACELSAGSALVFRGDVLHAGGANTTGRWRRALSTSFCCGWLRPVENSFTNIPLARVRALPRRAKELLGYALYDASEVGGGYLGYHEMGDPMRLVE